MRIRLSDRVQRNYESQDPAGQGSPIEIMSRIYPEMFGGGLSKPSSKNAQAGEADVLDLGIGSYLRTDPEIARAVSIGMEGRDLHYLRRPEVNELVAQKYSDEQGVVLDPQTQIFLTAGARTAMTLALLRLLNPGDRVIIPDPDYVGLHHVARGLGAMVVRVPMRRGPDGGLSVDVHRLTEEVHEGCRLVMITNPNNPAGYVWSLKELRALSDAIAEVDAVLLANEVYDKLAFTGTRHVSALAACDPSRSIIASGPGKAYDITGLGLGWLAGPKELLYPMGDVSFMFHIPTPSAAALYAAGAALSEPLRSQHPLRSVAILEENARLVEKAISEVPGFKFPRIGGGQFAFPWVGVDDVELCLQLRKAAGVSLMPGAAWGRMGRGHVRIALANMPEIHSQAVARLRAGLSQIDLLRTAPVAPPCAGVFNPEQRIARRAGK
jgi:aspartate/methionine/tyrosine aminotransferase